MNPERRYQSVSELTKQIKGLLEQTPSLTNVFLYGEISNFKHHSRGHMYFTIKDQKARISAVMFAGNNRHLRFRPENGLKVLVHGNISVYEPYGQYQLYVRMMEPDGIGQLYLAYEQLKKKLEAEGLFQRERKKSLPSFPKSIGIITSKTGAVIRDMYTTVKRRYPQVRLTLYPVAVQGPKSAPGIARALSQADRSGHDVIIAGRGGGSIEELWAFNDEQVVRTAASMHTPVISAVGHETDVTLLDFAADVRAATPTAAAEIAVPSVKELLEKVSVQRMRLQQVAQQLVSNRKERLIRLKSSYAFRYPEHLVNQKEQELDRQIDRLQRSMRQIFQAKEQRLEQLHNRYTRTKPSRLISEKQELLKKQTQQLQKEVHRLYERHQERHNHLLTKLMILNPLQTLKRGYTVTYQDEGLVTRVDDINIKDELQVHFQDGYIRTKALEIKKNDGRLPFE